MTDTIVNIFLLTHSMAADPSQPTKSQVPSAAHLPDHVWFHRRHKNRPRAPDFEGHIRMHGGLGRALAVQIFGEIRDLDAHQRFCSFNSLPASFALSTNTDRPLATTIQATNIYFPLTIHILSTAAFSKRQLHTTSYLSDNISTATFSTLRQTLCDKFPARKS